MSIPNPEDKFRKASDLSPWRAGFTRAAVLAAMALAVGGLQPAHSALAADTDEDADEPAAAAPTAASASAAAAPSRQRPILRVTPLDTRIQLLAKELDLSPVQQKQVRKVLLAQRDQVAAVWNDTAVPAALRVSRTQAIGDHTADQIRALLNDAQREKYIKPRVRETSVGSAGANVEKWTPPAKAK